MFRGVHRERIRADDQKLNAPVSGFIIRNAQVYRTAGLEASA